MVTKRKDRSNQSRARKQSRARRLESYRKYNQNGRISDNQRICNDQETRARRLESHRKYNQNGRISNNQRICNDQETRARRLDKYRKYNQNRRISYNQRIRNDQEIDTGDPESNQNGQWCFTLDCEEIPDTLSTLESTPMMSMEDSSNSMMDLDVAVDESSNKGKNVELDDELMSDRYDDGGIKRLNLFEMLAAANEEEDRALSAAEQRRLQAAATVRESDVDSDEEVAMGETRYDRKHRFNHEVSRFFEEEAGVDGDDGYCDVDEESDDYDDYYTSDDDQYDEDEVANTQSNMQDEGNDETLILNVVQPEVVEPMALEDEMEPMLQAIGNLVKEQKYCNSCLRTEVDTTCAHYHLDLKIIFSTQLRYRSTPLFKIELPSNRNQCTPYKICKACRCYLKPRPLHESDLNPVEQSKNYNGWRNTCFVFLSDLLFGREDNDRGMLFHEIYGCEAIWKLIPRSLRPFWLHEKGIREKAGYNECNLEEPKPLFEDVTEQVAHFQSDRKIYKLSNIRRMLEEKPDGTCDIIPHCLCPWGCSEFSFQGRFLDLPYILQKHLRKAPLNMPIQQNYFETFENVESSRSDFIRDYDDYASFMMNDKWVVRPSLIFVEDKGLMVIVCREHGDQHTRKRLHFHVPRKPGHTLCSETPAQLCHAVLNPRIIQPVMNKNHSSSFRIEKQLINYGGVSSASVSTTLRKFHKRSLILQQDEALSVAMRRDVNILLSLLVENSDVMPEFAEDIRSRARREFPASRLSKYTQGSTYVNIRCSVMLQNDMVRENGTRVTILSRCGEAGMEEREVLTTIERQWPPLINFMQMEDTHLYGYPFTAICDYHIKTGNRPVCMLWCLASCVMGCKELWICMDQKVNSFRYDEWDGYFLKHLCHKYIKYDTRRGGGLTPFTKRLCESNDLMSYRIAQHLPTDEISPTNRGTPEHFENYFMFSYNYWKNLFPDYCYQGIKLFNDHDEFYRLFEESTDNFNDLQILCRNKVVIVIDKMKPTRLECHLGSTKYEARVVNSICRYSISRNQDMFKAIRFVRHGDGFDNWWMQDRKHRIAYQCLDNNILANSQYFPESDSSVDNYYVTVYVRKLPAYDDSFKSDFLRCLGGQTHACCCCCSDDGLCYLIPTGRLQQQKRKCMIDECNGREAYICPKNDCNLCICNKCFASFPVTKKTSLKLKAAGGVSVSTRDFSDIAEVIDDQIHNDEINSDDETKVEDDYDCDDSLSEQEASTDEDSDEGDDEDLITYEDDNGSDNNGITIEASREAHESTDSANLNQHCYESEELLTRSIYDPLDVQQSNGGVNENGVSDNEYNGIPTTNAGEENLTFINYRQPLFIFFNQVGNICTRSNNKKPGSAAQQHFIQRLVSTVKGNSFPLLSLMGTSFTNHFYSEANLDSGAILGSPTISNYSMALHPFGFASTRTTAKMMITNPNSSTSNDLNLISYCFDVQCNHASRGEHSRIINRNGFQVDTTGPLGIKARGDCGTTLNESMDSHQGALDLAAAQKVSPFHLFLTFTVNQRGHLGLKHLHEHKSSTGWIEKCFGDLNLLNDFDIREAKRAMEQAYGIAVTRCWLEVSTLWLDYISYGLDSAIGKTKEVFYRHEYQEATGNVSHLHGLVSLDTMERNEKEFQEFLSGLQSCEVATIVSEKDIQHLLDAGLKDSTYWTVRDNADKILRHSCASRRCLVRRDTADGQESFRCKKPHPVFDSIVPERDEFVPIPVELSESCLDVLKMVGMYKEPQFEGDIGEFSNPMFLPKRHMGFCSSGARDNMSPAHGVWFAFTNSMQNLQLVHNTDGVARYIAKYVVNIDKGNRVVVWADSKNKNCFIIEKQFLHNTKTAQSNINEEKKFNSSKGKDHPTGRHISGPEQIHLLLSYTGEVKTSLTFTRICTKPLENRPSTNLTLNSNGTLKYKASNDNIVDSSSVGLVRRQIFRSPARYMSVNQERIFAHNASQNKRIDDVSQFGLRPVELVEICPRLGFYYRWFHISKTQLTVDEITNLLDEDVSKCLWIDGLGRHVTLRKKAKQEFLEFLLQLDKRGDDKLKEHSKALKNFLINILSISDSNEYDIHIWEKVFVFDDDHMNSLPVVVYSNIGPHQKMWFLLHLLLVLGEYETELDFKFEGTMRDCFVKCKIIEPLIVDDVINLEQDLSAEWRERAKLLMTKVITEIFPLQPLKMRKLDESIVTGWALIESVFLTNDMPNSDVPPCILTEILGSKEKELVDAWKSVKENISTSLYRELESCENLPKLSSLMEASRDSEIDWNLVEEMRQTSQQSESSFKEQQEAIKYTTNAIDKYTCSLGNSCKKLTKNVIIHGSPGTGKTYVVGLSAIYAMCKGLRVMTTSIMAARSNSLGGIHLHMLSSQRAGNPNRSPHSMALECLDNLNRKSNLKMRHILLTVDVLIIDEAGQWSAEQLSFLDILLRNLRNTNHSFGGVLLICSMDHAQLGSIKGLPFLISTFIMTSFTLVGLTQSVRAHEDKKFQRLQEITRMRADYLRENEKTMKKELMSALNCLTYVKSMDDPLITPNTQRMFAKKDMALKATENYVEHTVNLLHRNHIPYYLCRAHDYQKSVNSQAEFLRTTNSIYVNKLNKKVREPENIIFYKGALFEATKNTKEFQHSRVLLLYDMPDRETIEKRNEIKLLMPPMGLSRIEFPNGLPEKDALITDGWKEVTVGSEPILTTQLMGRVLKRYQYWLKHVGSSTIHKQMGNTIYGNCVFEFDKKSKPWLKEQIVVMLSRTRRGKDTIIVGTKEEFGEMVWKLLLKKSQWTDYIETILSNLTVNSKERHNFIGQNFQMAEKYPYRTCDIPIPNDSTGFVYYIVSAANVDYKYGYIGETNNLAVRFYQHNTGNGSKGTRDAALRPYALAGYICGLGHMDDAARMSLEHRWKVLCRHRRVTKLEDVLEIGQEIVEEYNQAVRQNGGDCITFVQTIIPR